MPTQNTKNKISSSLYIIGKFTTRGLFLGTLWGIFFVIYCFFNNLESIAKNTSLLSAHDQQLFLVPTLALTTVGFLLGLVSATYNLIYPKDPQSAKGPSHHQEHHPDDPAEMIWRLICAPFRMLIGFIQRNSATTPDAQTKNDFDQLLGDKTLSDPENPETNYGTMTQPDMAGPAHSISSPTLPTQHSHCIQTQRPAALIISEPRRTTTVPGGDDNKPKQSRCSVM